MQEFCCCFFFGLGNIVKNSIFYCVFPQFNNENNNIIVYKCIKTITAFFETKTNNYKLYC